MRRLIASFAVLAAVALPALAQEPPNIPTPFRIERGTALPPPSEHSTGQAVPVQGRSSGGIDFGQWRTADAEGYGFQFAAQMRARYSGQDGATARPDLEANGFACEGAAPLQCRLAVMDQGCTKEWYVVFERNRAEPVAGFDAMCPRPRS